MAQEVLNPILTEDASTTVKFGPSMERCMKAYRKAGVLQRIQKQLDRFIEHKMANPAEPFGSNDKSGAPLYAKFYKAHLTHDDSVVYRYDRKENVLRIYGIWSHDDLGLGNPVKPSVASDMAAKLDSQVFEQSPKSI